jgi:methionyl-tRNA synthetase
MRKVIIDLNKNLVILNDKFTELIFQFYDKQMRKLLEKLMVRSSTLFLDIVHAIEHLKWDKVADMMLDFLSEADEVMDDAAWRVALKPFDRFTHLIRELLQVIRTQVIFLDQYRQSHFAF